MPIYGAGIGSRAQLSTLVILNTQQPGVDTQRPTCNRNVIPLTVEPAAPNTFLIVNNNNTQVTHIGSGVYEIEKTGGTNGVRDAGAVSTTGVSGDFVLRLKPIATGASGPTTYQYGGGVNADPLTNDSYDTIDNLMFYMQGSGAWAVFESAVDQVENAVSGTYGWVWRTGSTLGYGRGDTLATANAAPDRTTTSTGTVYFDSTFWGIGDKLEATLFLPQDMVATSAVTFTDFGTLVGAGVLAGTLALTFSQTGTLAGAGSLAGASALTFTPSANLRIAVPIVAGSTLTFSSTAAMLSGIAASTTLTFSQSGTTTAKGALTGAPTLTFTPTAAETAKGSLAAAPTLTFSQTGTTTANGTLASASALTFTPTGSEAASGSLTATSPLVFAPVATLLASGSGAMVASITLTFSQAGTIQGQAAIAAAQVLTFTVAGVPKGSVALLASSALTFIGRGHGEAILWWVQPPADATFVNDNLANASWAETAIGQSSFTETPTNAGTWTDAPPGTGTWGD